MTEGDELYLDSFHIWLDAGTMLEGPPLGLSIAVANYQVRGSAS